MTPKDITKSLVTVGKRRTAIDALWSPSPVAPLGGRRSMVWRVGEYRWLPTFVLVFSLTCSEAALAQKAVPKTGVAGESFKSQALGITVVAGPAAEAALRSKNFPALGSRQCVLVTEVDETSPLRNKLRPYNVITTVNGQRTATLEAFKAATNDLEAGALVTIKGLHFRLEPEPEWVTGGSLNLVLPPVAVPAMADEMASPRRPPPATPAPPAQTSVVDAPIAPAKPLQTAAAAAGGADRQVVALSGEKPLPTLRSITPEEPLALAVKPVAKFDIRLPRPTDARLELISWSADSRRFAVASRECVAVYGSAPVRELLLVPVTDRPVLLALGNDGGQCAWVSESGAMSVADVGAQRFLCGVAPNPRMGPAKQLVFRPADEEWLVACNVGYRCISPTGTVTKEARWPHPVEDFEIAAFDENGRLGCFVTNYPKAAVTLQNLAAETHSAIPRPGAEDLAIGSCGFRNVETAPRILLGTPVGVAEAPTADPKSVRMVCGNPGDGSLDYVYGHPTLPWVCARSVAGSLMFQRTDSRERKPAHQTMLWYDKHAADRGYEAAAVSPDGTLVATVIHGQTVLLLAVTEADRNADDRNGGLAGAPSPRDAGPDAQLPKPTKVPESWTWTPYAGQATAAIEAISRPPKIHKPDSQIPAMAWRLLAAPRDHTVLCGLDNGTAVLWDCKKAAAGAYPFDLTNWRMSPALNDLATKGGQPTWPSYVHPADPPKTKAGLQNFMAHPNGTIGTSILVDEKALSPGAQHLINYSRPMAERWLRAWETKTGRPLTLATGNTDDAPPPRGLPIEPLRESIDKRTGVCVSDWDVSPASQSLAAVTRTSVVVWNLDVGTATVVPTRCRVGGDGIRGRVFFNPDGTLLLAAVQSQRQDGPDGDVHVSATKTDSWEQVWEHSFPNSSPEDVKGFTPNGTFILLESGRLLAADTGNDHHALELEGDRPRVMSFGDRNDLLAVFGDARGITLWDYVHGNLIATFLCDEPAGPTALCVTNGAEYLVGGTTRVPLDLAAPPSDQTFTNVFAIRAVVENYMNRRAVAGEATGTAEKPHVCNPMQLYQRVVDADTKNPIQPGSWVVLDGWRVNKAFPAGHVNREEVVGMFLKGPSDDVESILCLLTKDVFARFDSSSGDQLLLCRVHSVRNVQSSAAIRRKQVVVEGVDLHPRSKP